MQVEIYLKDGKEKFIKNVKSISNMVDFVDGKPVFYLRMTVGNDDKEIKYEDINSFSVYDSGLEWIKGKNIIICPHCNAKYHKDILDMSINNNFMSFCPSCGKKVLK